MTRVLYITLGCAKNEVDTDRMRALLTQSGFDEAFDTEDADIALVNTCSFLVSATQESIEATLTLAEELHEGVRKVPIVMCGCVPSRYGDELEAELPEVSAFVRTDEEDDIVEVVRRVLGMDAPSKGELMASLRTVQGSSAFVKISDGCDRFCTFCAIPQIRGPYYSRPAHEILDEVVALAEGGVREFVLIGQDTGVWGCDFTPRETLASLLVRVGEALRPYGAWIRVLYLQPEGMTDELIAAMRDTPEVLPYIDIPIQHCSAAVLRNMGRSGDAQSLAALFGRLRREIPGMVLRSTALAGFPGETDEEADELLRFLEEQELDYCSVFAYSPEDGTAAASFEGQVDEQTKIERTQALTDLAERLGFAATARHVGERVDVIIDGIENEDGVCELIGHAWFQAPDSDGAIHIAEGAATVGEIVTCDLVDSFCYELVAEIVEEETADERG